MTGISPELEAAIFARYAAGATTRAVSREFGIGSATASRAFQRFKAAQKSVQETPAASEPAEPETGMTGLPLPDLDAELAELQRRRGELAEVVSMHEERAAASRSAVQELEAERLETLAGGHDAQPLRQRRRDAEDDLADSETAAGFARERLAAVDQQIAAVQARIDDARLRGELAEAIAERDSVLAGIGDRQRAAVLAVRAAAEDFTAAAADEREAVRRVDDLTARIALGGPAPVVPLPASTAISVPGAPVGAEPVALLRAISEARIGNMRVVALRLGEACGWLPASAAELASEAERRQAVMAGQQVQAPGPARPLVPAPAGWGAEFGLDADGRPLRQPYPRHPSDSYRAPMSAWPPPGVRLGSYDG